MINFMKYKWLYFLISAVVILPGVISLLLFGFNLSIDFTGGTLWEVRITGDESRAVGERIEAAFSQEGMSAEAQPSGENQFLIKTVPLDQNQRQLLAEKLETVAGKFEELRFGTLGPRLGSELLRKSAVAMVLAILVLFAYIAYRFRHWLFGAAAILAVFHDLLVLLGVFSLLGYFWQVPIDTLFVTAVLTTLSFSVHDTIVVFDRIREIRRRVDTSLEEAVNQAVGETLVRSLNNSLTIVFMLVALLVLGGETLKYFVLALLIGTMTGTYSSTFNAAPLLLVLRDLGAKLSSWRNGGKS